MPTLPTLKLPTVRSAISATAGLVIYLMYFSANNPVGPGA